MALFSGGQLGPEDAGRRRRLHTRQPFDLELEQFTAWDPQSGWQPLRGQLVDLSPGGAGILLDRELPEGTPVRLFVSLPALRRGKEGRVAHSQRLEDTPSLWRVGIAFPPVPPSTTELLGARAVCWGSLIVVVSSFAGQEHGFGTYVSLAVLVILLLGLAIGAELTYRASLRRYREQRLRWESPFPAIATPVEAHVKSEVRGQT